MKCPGCYEPELASHGAETALIRLTSCRTKSLTVLVVAMFSLFGGTVSDSSAQIVLTTPAREPLAPGKDPGFLDSVAIEAFRRLGMRAQVIILPPRRALSNANAGVQDGDLPRIAGLETSYPNLIRVPEKVMDAEFSAFSAGLDFPTDSWKSIEPFAVGTVRGIKVFEDNIGNVREVVAVNSHLQLFSMLERGRVDLILFARSQGIWWARKLGFKVHVLEPPLATRELFMYLHKKHRSLVPRVADALAEMKRDGTYRKIREMVLGITPRQPDRGPGFGRM